MTVLATQFDSLRRAGKYIGRQRLFILRTRVPEGTWFKIIGDDAKPQAIQFARDKSFGEYDVFVNDAPTSPDKKEATWAVIAPLLGVFKDQLMANPLVLIQVLQYSPLPTKLVDSIRTMIMQQQNDPKAQQEQEQMKQIGMQSAIAKVAKDDSTAKLNYGRAGGDVAYVPEGKANRDNL